MSFGSETLVAGPYTATWNSAALGIFEGGGSLPTLQYQRFTEDIDNTSAYGRALLDGIYLGMAVFFQMVCQEYKAGSIGAAFPQHATKGRLGTIGVMEYASHSASLVLTAVAGTTAATSPATLTSSKSCLAPGFTVSLAYGPTLRKVPLRLRAFVQDVGSGNAGFFSET